MKSVLLFVLGLLGFVASIPYEIQGSRLVQVDINDPQDEEAEGSSEAVEFIKLGSRRSGVSAEARALNDDSSSSRSCLLVRFSEVDSDEVVAAAAGRSSAVVVILPRDGGSQMTAESVALWSRVEAGLVARAWDIPIYFVRETDAVLEMYHEVTRGSSSYHVMSSISGDAPRLASVSLHNIKGFLTGTSKGSGSEKTLAVVAYYDTLGAAPGLRTGADSNGSGVAALLELARLFSLLYEAPGAHGSHSVLFVLTSGGQLNFAGARHWLSAADPRTLDTIEFALCLDSIGAIGDRLYLHVSRKPSTKPGASAALAAMHQAFAASAAALNITLEVVHKPINMSDPTVSWEHEQFSRKKIAGGTLSRLARPAPGLSRPSLFDSRERVSVPNLLLTIRFIAESLARRIYGLEAWPYTEIFGGEGGLAVSQDYVVTVLGAVSALPRVSHSIEPSVVDDISRMLEDHVQTSVSRFTWESAGAAHYGHLTSTLTVYKLPSVFTGLILAVSTFLYLVAIYAFLRGPRESYGEFKRLFAPKAPLKSSSNKK